MCSRRPNGVDDLLTHGRDGVEGHRGLLEDHRDPGASELRETGRAAAVLAGRDDLLPLERDASAGDGDRGREDAEDRAQGHALARAGLPDEPACLTGADREGHVLEDVTGLRSLPDTDGEVVDGEDGLRRPRVRSWAVLPLDPQGVGEALAHQRGEQGSRAPPRPPGRGSVRSSRQRGNC